MNSMLPREQVNLVEWGILFKNKRKSEEIVNLSIKGKIHKNSVRKFGEMVEKCFDLAWVMYFGIKLCLAASETAIKRELHQDSCSGASASLELPISSHFTFDTR